jgi:hypothetical protein
MSFIQGFLYLDQVASRSGGGTAFGYLYGVKTRIPQPGAAIK